jgi:peptidoglycan hydrolase-like protein with peptidoglycan-binding domain
MTRKLALVVGVLLGAVPAAGLLAQTPAAKPNPSSGMQHAPSVAPTKSAQQDTAATKSATRTHAHHPKWTKDQVKEAQAGLAKAGYYKGEPNGVYDKKTRKAIRAYQKANNLPVNGHLNDELLSKLGTA